MCMLMIFENLFYSHNSDNDNDDDDDSACDEVVIYDCDSYRTV